MDSAATRWGSSRIHAPKTIGRTTLLSGLRFRQSIVGDDLVVTNAARIGAAAREGLIDAALIKPNQAGTVTDARAALEACKDADIMPIVSARSGETEDVSIVHLAVGWQAPMIKVGSITRGERTAKWNEGLPHRRTIARRRHTAAACAPLTDRSFSHAVRDLLLDKPDSLDLRMATRNAHLAYMDTKPIDIVLAGPLLDDARRNARLTVHRRS